MQDPASTTTWWSIGRGTCMEVVRNRETHAGRSTAVKMIMASQIMGPHLSNSNSLSNHTALCLQQRTPSSSRISVEPIKGTVPPPSGQEKPRLRLLNSIQHTNFVSMDCARAMEQSLKKTAVHIYRVQYTARPSRSRRTPDGRSVWHAALRMECASYCIRKHMWDGN